MAFLSSLNGPTSKIKFLAKLTDFSSNALSLRRNLAVFESGYKCFGLKVDGKSLWESRVLHNSEQIEEFINVSDVPLLSSSEVFERLKEDREKRKGKQQFLAMYSSVFGGITTDPTTMVIPMDDHMVHRGHGVFDTAAIMDGEGSLRYWLSVGPGDFQLSPSGCKQSALYAIVIQDKTPLGREGVKVWTSTVPIKPPQFATMKSVNYLPNVLSKMEAEEKGGFAAIWLDEDGYIAEGPNMNVAFVTKENGLLMPSFDKILSGCTARRALSLSEGLVREGRISGIRVGNVTMEEGKQACEMMLIGSGILAKVGPVGQALLDLILDDMKFGPTDVRVPVPY
ncbi:hypothetical protein IFM89_029761 [Coptis chinensis]|uniref:Uncharacterized protein n=1 Tax=Coptis chinensis TaxID=261450 RepID=A0A835M7D1_9MAGN|nr:hypothetical protein IFM89_029761 [Coptis chinensis]